MNADLKYGGCSWHIPGTKLILMSLPRTGNTAVRLAIANNHLKIGVYEPEIYGYTAQCRLRSASELKELIASGYKFIATVKNPVSRLISFYRKFIYFGSQFDEGIPAFWHPDIFYERMPFEQFVLNICRTHNAKLDQHYAPQTFLISVVLNAEPEEWMPHVRVAHAENLETELFPMLSNHGINLTGLHRANVTPLCPENVSFTEEMKDLVNRKFADDFRILGYDPLPKGGDA